MSKPFMFKKIRKFDISQDSLAAFSRDCQLIAHRQRTKDYDEVIVRATVPFADLSVDAQQGTVEVMQPHFLQCQTVSAISFRPNQFLNANSQDYCGFVSSNELLIADYRENQILRYLPGLRAFMTPLTVPEPTALACDRSGRFLACGTASGELYIFDLRPLENRRISADLPASKLIGKYNFKQGKFVHMAFGPAPAQWFGMTDNGRGFTARFDIAANNPHPLGRVDTFHVTSYWAGATSPQTLLTTSVNRPQIALGGDQLLICGYGYFQNSQFRLKTELDKNRELVHFLPEHNQILIAGPGLVEIHIAPPLGAANTEIGPDEHALKLQNKVPVLSSLKVWEIKLESDTTVVAAAHKDETLYLACAPVEPSYK